MLWRLRGHLNAPTVIATIALVFAMSGGAYAVSHYLITSVREIKAGVLGSLKGKTGLNGRPSCA